jgi:hypothetical protein
MSIVSLGRFGDRRLEKGGSFCMTVWFRRAVKGYGFGGWAGIGREKSG